MTETDGPTIASLLRERAEEDTDAIRFEDKVWSFREYVAECRDRAALLEALLADDEPEHVGLLMDNTPEFCFWLGAVALAGATAVGINPTRQGAELARDITHTDCRLIVTEPAHRHELDGLDLGLEADRILDVESDDYAAAVARHAGADWPDAEIEWGTQYLLLFTSGTSGAPKACICSQGRIARAGWYLAEGFGFDSDSCIYLAMPMFHSNALMAGWSASIAGGAPVALRRRFSASGFLTDARRYGVTYFNYVGKPLAFILATPEQPDDADNPVQFVFGNEAAEADIARFGERFGCVVIDNYGSTEGGVNVTRDPEQPAGALGRATDDLDVRDPETGEACPRAEFDADGRLVNAEEAIGEMVSRSGAETFEGYYNNDEANRQRVRDGFYWTGDLVYRDADDFVYFAGRGFEWIRVDGENFAAAPIERIIGRHDAVQQVAAYAVPDEQVGDQVMAALVLDPTADLDGEAFADFLAAQPDMGTKWAPRYVRIAAELPSTQTNKVLKRVLRGERWDTDDEVWWRPDRTGPYRRLTAEDRAAIHERFVEYGNESVLDVV